MGGGHGADVPNRETLCTTVSPQHCADDVHPMEQAAWLQHSQVVGDAIKEALYPLGFARGSDGAARFVGFHDGRGAAVEGARGFVLLAVDAPILDGPRAALPFGVCSHQPHAPRAGVFARVCLRMRVWSMTA